MTQTLSPQRRLMQLAWPAIVENLSASLVIFIDSAMVGSLGAIATASVAVNASPSWLMNGLMMSVGVGGTALISRAWGARDTQGARTAAWHTLAAGLTMSLLLAVAAFLLAPLIPRWMGADPAIHPDAAAYMRLVAIGALPNYLGATAAALLRGIGDTASPMKASLMSHLVNITGNFLLIFPTRTLSLLGFLFTMPGAGLGVRGAAMATAFSFLVSGGYLLYWLMHGRQLGLRFKEHSALRTEEFKRLIRISVPAALERVSINLGQIVFAGMVIRFGTHALAAHHLSITIESLGYMPAYGFAVAAATLVGQSLGAKQPDQARILGLRAIKTGTLVTSTIGIGMFVFADALISLFTPDLTVRAIGAGMIRICAFEQPFSALSIISPGALRGAGDTTAPFVVSLFSMWGVRIVFAWLLGIQWGLGVQGIWIAMLLDLAVRGCLLLYRFLKGDWKSRQV